MIRRTTFSFGALVLASFTLGCSATYEGTEADADLESESDALFGSLDPANLLQLYAKGYSVPIRNIGTTAAGDGVCTGTQVRRNAVLTANHCITKDGTISGSVVAVNQILVGRAGLDSWNLVSGTAADCLASTDCNRVKTYLTNSVDDLALLFLEPAEARATVDDSIYVPLISTLPSHVNTTVEVAGYGKYNPFNNADPANLALNFGRFTVTAVNTANTVTGNRGGVTTKLSGNESNKLQGGDSGSGIWTQTNPPGILSVLSGATQNCNFDTSLCTTAQGPDGDPFQSWVNWEDNERDPFWPVGARDWEFNNATDFGDFDLVKVDPAIGSPGWQVSSGNFTPWNNVDANFMLARTVMERGCVQTSVRTDDNDESGIVFRHMDNANYYYFYANDQANRIGIRRVSNGTNTELTQTTWNGTWVVTTPLLVCFYNNSIQAFVNPGTASEVSLATIEEGSIIIGGRLGLWNDFNQAARHGYLRTMSVDDGQERVLNWLRI
jgi:hypothetical protein